MLALLFGVLAMFGSRPVSAATGPEVPPKLVDGNPSCASQGYAYELRIDASELVNNKTYTAATTKETGDSGPLSVTLSNLVYNSGEVIKFDWKSNNVSVDAVLVKAQDANAFVYDPAVGESMGDDGLYAPQNRGVSHISFCYDLELKAEKTANGNYDRKIDWTLDKSVDDESHSGQAGQDAGTSEWTVTATKSVVENNHAVTGTITVTNPALVPVPFSVSDALNDGTKGSVDCDKATAGNQASGIVAAGGSITCTYTASPGDANATTNKAVVTSNHSGVSGGTALASIAWKANVIGDESVKVDDDRNPADFPATISKTTSWSYDETFECSDEAADYKDGKLGYTADNVATLTGDNNDLNDKASVAVDCALQALSARKTADGSYDRTIDWDLTKTVDPSSHSGNAGEPAGASEWTVTATKNEQKSNYKVTGNIIITNPSAVAVPVSVTDELDDGTIAEVNCPSATVPAESSITCSYSAAPSGSNAKLNTATISGAGNADVTTTADVRFTTENVIGSESATLADPRFNYSETINSTTTKTFPETFACPSDPSRYTDGSSSRTEENIATLEVGGTTIKRDASVEVKCVLPKLIAEKTAAGSYDRTITWKLEKSVNPASHSGQAGDSFNSTWSVTATKSEALGGYKVTGDITIKNPAGIPLPYSVTDELNDGTIAAVDCDPVAAGNQDSGSLAGNSSTTCTYTASPKDATATLNTATISSGDRTTVAETRVSFEENVKGDRSVTLADPRFNYSQPINDTTTVPFPERFACSTNSADYTNGSRTDVYQNTATLTGESTNLRADAEVKVSCTLPPPPPPTVEACTPGFWQGGSGAKIWNTRSDPDWKGYLAQPYHHNTEFNKFFTPHSRLNGQTMFQVISNGATEIAANKAARSLVAAYLNTSHKAGYPYSQAQLKNMWTNAVNSGNSSLHDLHLKLDEANNNFDCRR